MTPHPIYRSSATAVRTATAVGLLLLALVVGGCGSSMPLLSSKSSPASGSKDDLREAEERTVTEPAEVYWPFRAGEILATRDSLREAESMLKIALDRNPDHAATLSLLSRIWFEHGRHQEAVTLLEAARTRPGAFPDGLPQELRVGLALHYDALDRPDLSRAALAGGGTPDDASRSAVVYLALRGAVSDSVAGVTRDGIGGSTRTAADHNNLGIVKLRGGDPNGARKLFQAAIEKDPKLPGPYYNLAILEKFWLLDDEAADRWFRAYRQRSNEDPDSLFAVFGKSPGRKLAQEEQR